VFFFKKKSKNDLCIIWNLQKTNYIISKHWMGQKIVTVLANWSEEDERGEVGEDGDKVPRIPFGIDQSFEIDLLKWS
jgi:hypothetical protein